jgi:hypothetical protein
MAKKPTIEAVDASLARWKTRLRRAMTAITKLEAQRKRLAAKQAVPASTLVAAVKGHIARSRPRAHADLADLGATLGPAIREAAQDAGMVPVKSPDLDIPEFLRRGKAAQEAADQVIADGIREEQAATKKAKAAGRIAKLKAKKSGELKKMPLSGRAALDAIRNG